MGKAEEPQIPVDVHPGYLTELTFTIGSGAVAFRTIATNSTTVGSYSSGTEYWYTRTQALGSSLTLTSSASTYTSGQLDTFHSDCSNAFSWTQVVGTTAWTTGTYTPTTGRTAKLYKATDPDNGRVSIGILTEQDTSDALKRVVWFKTSDTGTIFGTTPASLSFTQVLDGGGNPSTNPNDIQNTTWYHVASP